MKIKSISIDEIEFDNGSVLDSEHRQNCCEHHYVDFTSMEDQFSKKTEFPENLNDLVVLDYNSEKDNIRGEKYTTFVILQDKKGRKYTLNIYNENNGYYGTEVILVLTTKKGKETRLLIQK